MDVCAVGLFVTSFLLLVVLIVLLIVGNRRSQNEPDLPDGMAEIIRKAAEGRARGFHIPMGDKSIHEPGQSTTMAVPNRVSSVQKGSTDTNSRHKFCYVDPSMLISMPKEKSKVFNAYEDFIPDTGTRDESYEQGRKLCE